MILKFSFYFGPPFKCLPNFMLFQLLSLTVSQDSITYKLLFEALNLFMTLSMQRTMSTWPTTYRGCIGRTCRRGPAPCSSSGTLRYRATRSNHQVNFNIIEMGYGWSISPSLRGILCIRLVPICLFFSVFWVLRFKKLEL